MGLCCKTMISMETQRQFVLRNGWGMSRFPQKLTLSRTRREGVVLKGRHVRLQSPTDLLYRRGPPKYITGATVPSERTVTTAFGLREKQGQRRLVRLDSDDADRCASTRYALTFSEGYPLFEVDTAERAAYVLAVNTPWYNSSTKRPRWGSLSTDDLEVVCLTQTVVVESVAISPPVQFASALESYVKTWRLASRYLGRELPDQDLGGWTLRLVPLPDGESADSLREKCTDRFVLYGEMQTVEFCWGLCTLPEEYEDLFTATPGVGIVTTARAPRSSGQADADD